MKELTEVGALRVESSRLGLFLRSRRNARLFKAVRIAALSLALGALTLCGVATAPSAQAVTLNWSAVKEPGVGGAVTSIEVCPTDSNKVVVGGDMLGATYSTDGGATWNDSFGLTNWECADATWAPGSTSTVWMGTMGGPFKSTDGGRNWVAKRSGMPAPETYWGYNVPIQKMIFDPNNSSRMLAFGGSHRDWSTGKTTAKMGSVWESTNGGESWTQKAMIADGGAGVGGDVMTAEFASGSSTIVYAATRNSGVYRSNDGGATWTAKNSGLPTTTTDFIAVHPTSAGTLWWCGVGKRAVYKSTDGGDNWSFSGNGLAFDTTYDHLYRMITVSPANSNVLYVSNASWQSLFKSTDGGANWSNVAGTLPPTPTGLYVQGVWTEIDPNNANTVYTCNSVTIFKSTDAGANWTDVSSKAGSSTGLWQGRGYSGYVSTKVKWNPYNTNQAVLQAMDDGKFMSSTDDLLNWKMRGTGMNQWSGGNDVTFGGTGGSTIYVAQGQWGSDSEAPARSTDGGASWTYLTNPGSGVSQSIYTLPSDTTKVWLIRNGRLYYSSNSGSSWAELNVDNNINLRQIVGDNASPPNIYIAAQNGAYKGSASNSFTRAATVESSNDMHIALDPSKTGRFYLASWLYNQYNCGIYRVDNGTQTRIADNLYSYDVAVDPQNANRVVMVTNHDPGVEISQATGVWMTENALDATPIWTQQNTGLPMLRGKAIAIHPTNGTIIVGLNGRGFYKTNTSGAAATPTPTPASSTFKARFYPRSNFANRMTGGKFQGSTSSSTSGYVDLATISSQPADAWTELGIGNTQYRYLRYLAPASGFGNVAEVEFYNGMTKLSGTRFGTAGSWSGTTSDTSDKAQDGNTGTFFDANVADGAYTGLDINATPALLSQGKTAFTSSTQDTTLTADKAFDGDVSTRWASAGSDPQWIYVDLGAGKTITQIKLNWEAACGKDYVLQTAADGATGLSTDTPWTTIQSVTGNTTVGVLTYNVSGSGRYVRMKSTARVTQWGNSLWEMQVFGY